MKYAGEEDNSLELAFKIAVDAHSGQTDRGGNEYIVHPLRVSDSLDSDKAKIVGMLHDAVEDSDLTISDIENRFDDDIVSSIDTLTKRSNEDYSEYLSRVKEDELAREVKLVDLEDNLDISRLEKIEDDDIARMRKYLDAYEMLSL